MNKIDDAISKITISQSKVVIIKGIIFLVTIILVCLKIIGQDVGWQHVIDSMKIFDENKGMLMIAVMLMPVNWTIEAMKWKLLVSKLESLTIWEALKGVICGLSLGFVTPRSIGEYIGRILMLNSKNRELMIGPIFLGRISQMLITLLFGTWGIAVYIANGSSLERNHLVLIAFSIMVIVMVLVLIFRLPKLETNNFIIQRFYKWVKIIPAYNFKQVAQLLWLSFLRYLVFSIQFVILLKMFLPELNMIDLFSGVSWIFLIKSIVPSFNFLADLGIRELSALQFFDSYEVIELNILTGTLSLWILNLLIPSILGTVLLWRMNIINK